MIIYTTGVKHSSPRLGYKVDTIVVHATGSTTAKSAIQHFSNPLSRVSAHYIIDKDGTIYACVPEHAAAWHAGKCYLPCANLRSIGIELVNRNTGDDPYPDPQILSLRQLIVEIKRRHPIKYLVSHAEIAKPKGRKTDPKGLSMAELRAWTQLEYTTDAPAQRVITSTADTDQPPLISQDDDTAGTERA